MENYKISRISEKELELCGLIQTVDFKDERGHQSNRINGKEESLKTLVLCDDKGFMNPGGHFDSNLLNGDTLRVTNVFYGDSLGYEVQFSFDDYIRMNKTQHIYEQNVHEYYYSEKANLSRVK